MEAADSDGYQRAREEMQTRIEALEAERDKALARIADLEATNARLLADARRWHYGEGAEPEPDANIPTRPGWYYWQRRSSEPWEPAYVGYQAGPFEPLRRIDGAGNSNALSVGNWGGPVPEREE